MEDEKMDKIEMKHPEKEYDVNILANKVNEIIDLLNRLQQRAIAKKEEKPTPEPNKESAIIAKTFTLKQDG